MAKPIQERPPSSVVARLLDTAAAARAIQPRGFIEHTRPDSRNSPDGTPAMNPITPGTPRHVKREITLTPQANETLDTLVELCRRATGTRLSTSHVLRAVLVSIMHSMPFLDYEMMKVGPLKLPGNSPDRQSEREHFESRLAQALLAGIRRAPAFTSD